MDQSSANWAACICMCLYYCSFNQLFTCLYMFWKTVCVSDPQGESMVTIMKPAIRYTDRTTTQILHKINTTETNRISARGAYATNLQLGSSALAITCRIIRKDYEEEDNFINFLNKESEVTFLRTLGNHI